MLFGLPLCGIYLADLPVTRYLEFPPHRQYVTHAAFSWPHFIAYAVFILAVIIPLSVRGLGAARRSGPPRSPVRPYPWWGWAALGGGGLFWVLAWNRYPWFAFFQPHTFCPLWLAYIVTVNAIAYRRTGRSMLTHQPAYFLFLFPVSALFWWFFEFLNRFVQNWYYSGVLVNDWEYFWYGTLSFSTVLPAVLGTAEVLGSAVWLQSGFTRFVSLPLPRTRWVAGLLLLLAASGLTGIGVWPNQLFALLWISPLLIFIALQILAGEANLLDDLVHGDWRVVIASAGAALVCGFFWEMWNFYSLAKWHYNVPYVDRFHLFEMPLLGYAGYLPFGLECAVIGRMFRPVEP
jgi:hypothetical protein